jgi:hypothetical protein
MVSYFRARGSTVSGSHRWLVRYSGARWDEIDMAAAVWTVLPERMKGG